ncbi:MAG TPA: hypothetical protein VFF39_10925 [Verrucomicrobiae bacterium]|nr:hypothetical protein [Verrucomicrobiae bacterium]
MAKTISAEMAPHALRQGKAGSWPGRRFQAAIRSVKGELTIITIVKAQNDLVMPTGWS